MWRLIFLIPYLIRFPKVSRTIYLVWRLIFDRRVPWLLRLLVPASIVYFVTPIARLPFIGPIGFIIVLLLAVWLLLNLAPRHVIDSHTGNVRREERDPKRVVEGRYKVVDEDTHNDREMSK